MAKVLHTLHCTALKDYIQKSTKHYEYAPFYECHNHRIHRMLANLSTIQIEPSFHIHESGFNNPSLPYTISKAASAIGMKGRDSSDSLKNRIDYYLDRDVKLAVRVNEKERKWYFNRDFAPEYRKLDPVYPELK